MSEEASRLMKLALDAYAERNASLGVAIDDIDDTLDGAAWDAVALDGVSRLVFGSPAP
jgi:hypothetical protein